VYHAVYCVLSKFAKNLVSSDALINQAAFIVTDLPIDNLPGQIVSNAVPQVTVRNVCMQTQLAYRMLTMLVLSGNIPNYYHHYGLYTKHSSKDRYTTARYQIASFCEPPDYRIRLGGWYAAGIRQIQSSRCLSRVHIKRLQVRTLISL
jgi:hypothetical protein